MQQQDLEERQTQRDEQIASADAKTQQLFRPGDISEHQHIISLQHRRKNVDPKNKKR